MYLLHQMIRPVLKTIFKLCKDLEYVSLLYLMEEVIPLLFFNCLVIFITDINKQLQTKLAYWKFAYRKNLCLK